MRTPLRDIIMLIPMMEHIQYVKERNAMRPDPSAMRARVPVCRTVCVKRVYTIDNEECLVVLPSLSLPLLTIQLIRSVVVVAVVCVCVQCL